VDHAKQTTRSTTDPSDAEALAVLRLLISNPDATNHDLIDAMYARDSHFAAAAELRKQVANLTIAVVRAEGKTR
jgi:hypothetical protein